MPVVGVVPGSVAGGSAVGTVETGVGETTGAIEVAVGSGAGVCCDSFGRTGAEQAATSKLTAARRTALGAPPVIFANIEDRALQAPGHTRVLAAAAAFL